MTELEPSLNEEELIGEVRKSLAGIDDGKIPDGTIVQASERFVVPLLNDITGSLEPDEDQEAFDNAVISWTAEKAFDAWLTYTRLRDREVTIYLNPEAYQEDLRERTNLSLQLLDATRPPEVPNTVISVKHDGIERRVNLHDTYSEL